LGFIETFRHFRLLPFGEKKGEKKKKKRKKKKKKKRKSSGF